METKIKKLVEKKLKSERLFREYRKLLTEVTEEVNKLEILSEEEILYNNELKKGLELMDKE